MLQFYTKAMNFAPLNLPIITTSSPLPPANQGQPYSTTLASSGGTAPYTYALIGGSLDSGLSLSPAGVISGTPVNAETDTLTIQVTDVHNLYTSSVFSLTTLPVGLSFLTTSPLPNATQGVPYSYNAITAQGGIAPYTYLLLSSTGVDTYTVSMSGIVNGTPGVHSLLLGTELGVAFATEVPLLMVTALS
jgi:hypothetical protein